MQSPGLFKPVIDVKHRTYCGPVAISAFTGVPISRIEKMIRRVRSENRKRHKRPVSYGKRSARRLPIKGTYSDEVVTVLQRLGCKVEPDTTPASTFGAFIHDTATVSAAYLVEVTGHWMTTFRGMFCDTSSIDAPVPYDGSFGKLRHGKRRVRQVWRVIAPATPRYTIDDPITAPTRPAPKPRPDIKTVRAQRIIDKIAEWERKKKRAETALKKLRAKASYYRRAGVL